MQSVTQPKLIVKVGHKEMVFTRVAESKEKKRWEGWQIANSYAAYLAGLQTWKAHQDLIEELEKPIQQTREIAYRLETI